MLIQMLYWQNLWTRSVATGVVNRSQQVNSPEEQAAFTRRLAKFSEMRLVRYPAGPQCQASHASEHAVSSMGCPRCRVSDEHPLVGVRASNP